MQRPSLFLLITITLLCMGLIAQPNLSHAGDRDNPLVMSAELSRDGAKFGDRIFIVTTIENKGNVPVVLRGMRDLSAGGGFALSVINPRGQSIALPPRPGASLIEAQTGSRLIALPIGAGLRIRFPLDIQSVFASEGTYSVVLSYRSPQPASGNPSVLPGRLEAQTANPVSMTLKIGAGASE